MLVKWLVITSIIYVLCNAIIRKMLSSVPELSNCPGSFRLLYFKDRVSQLVDPHHLLHSYVPVARGGGRSSQAFKPHFVSHFLGGGHQEAPHP